MQYAGGYQGWKSNIAGRHVTGARAIFALSTGLHGIFKLQKANHGHTETLFQPTEVGMGVALWHTDSLANYQAGLIASLLFSFQADQGNIPGKHVGNMGSV